MKNHTKAFALLLGLALLMPVTAFAQGTTGTIRGRVRDQATGDPLPAVNVILLDAATSELTQMGAFTNADGEFVIINVPPSRYHIRATMMGYTTFEVQDLLVTVGVSTTQDFHLEATVLDVGEVVTVTAEREMIQRDVTSTQQSYTIEEMERMAVSSTTDILALQTNTYTLNSFQDDIPGYYDRGLEQVHMRGGRNAEVAFMIDGMQVTNLVFGGQAAQVSHFSLSEMVVMAGGMSAEFGNAMSGVVNMITREGGSSLDANMEIQSSEWSWQSQDTERNRTNFSGYLGGPVPMLPRTTFFMSGSAGNGRSQVIKRDDILYNYAIDPYDPTTYGENTYPYMPLDPADFDPEEHDPYTQYGPDGRRIHGVDVFAGYQGLGFDNNWNGMLNTTYKFSPAMKTTWAVSKDGRWAVPYTWEWRHAILWGYDKWTQDYWLLGIPTWDDVDDYGNIIGDPNNDSPRISQSGNLDFHNEKNLLFYDNYRISGVWTHQLSPTTFYSARTAYYDYNRTMRVKRWVNDLGWIKKEEHIYWNLEDDPTDPTYGMPLPPLWTPDDPMRQVTLEWILGGYDTTDPHRQVYGYYPYSSSGAGVSYEGSDRYYTNHNEITRTLKADVTSQVTTHHQLKSGILYNALTLDMNDVQFPWSTAPSQTRYVKHPWELGLYLQDKVEYDFLILNLGIRYDATAAGQQDYWLDPRNPIHPDTLLTDEQRLIVWPDMYYTMTGIAPPVRQGRTNSSIAPRFGISHPVTDQSVVYFNYGHFYQKPIYRNVYRINRIDRGNPITGNPNLENEKTVSYEFGYKHQFTDILALEATMWAKDQSNMVGTERVPAWFQGLANPYEYTVAINYDYAVSKGFDLNLNKRYSNFWSGRVSYSYMTSVSNRDDPWQGYRDGSYGTLEQAPKRPRVVGWDQPHRVSASFSVQLPEGAGPEMVGIRPLERSSMSIIYRASAGRPYTPTNIEGLSLEQNSGRRPWTFQWDLKLYRDFSALGIRYSLIADVRNVFDRKNITSVYSRTGKPDDPGPDATSYSDNYDRWHYYGTPRTFSLGLRIFF